MDTWRQDLGRLVIAGAALGLVAGAVVWFLERFESERLHAEVRTYMENYDAFRTFLAQRGETELS